MQIEIKQQIDSRVKLILELEGQGIPIDWKQLTLQIYNTVMAEEKDSSSRVSELLGDDLFGDA
jgi:hypothetical protein